QRFPECDAGYRALTEHPERPVRLPDPAHDVMDPSRPETLLRENERLTLITEAVRNGDPDVGVDDLRVTRVVERDVALAHRRDVAKHVHAGRVPRDDDHRHP